MATCLVTGGAGFLGSHLCDELLRRGHRVICVDNVETGSLANMQHIRTPEFRFVHTDIIDPYFVDEPVDFVYHFASPASPIDYLRLPLHTLKVGSHGTHHTLGLAKAHRARFLLASTSEVYGDPKVHPQPESYWGHVNPIGPRGVYDEAKRYAEALTMAYHRQQGVDTAIVRIFNTYGPRMRPHDGRAIPTFLRQALQDRPITVFGDGVADALVLLRRRPDRRDHPARGVRLPPAGQHRQPERVHAARARRTPVIEVTGSRSEIVHEALPADDPQVRQPDISPGARDPRLGADGRAARGAAPDARGIRRRGAHGVGLVIAATPRHCAVRMHARCAKRQNLCDAGGVEWQGTAPMPDVHRARPGSPPAHRRAVGAAARRHPAQAPAGALVPAAMDTLRRLARVLSLLALDFVGVFAAIFTALMVKAVVREGDWAWRASFDEAQATRRLRLPRHRAAVRPLRALRRARAAARPAADRLLALPGHASSR